MSDVIYNRWNEELAGDQKRMIFQLDKPKKVSGQLEL